MRLRSGESRARIIRNGLEKKEKKNGFEHAASSIQTEFVLTGARDANMQYQCVLVPTFYLFIRFFWLTPSTATTVFALFLSPSPSLHVTQLQGHYSVSRLFPPPPTTAVRAFIFIARRLQPYQPCPLASNCAYPHKFHKR